MKKALWIFLLLATATAYAGTADLFQYNRDMVDRSLAAANVLDRYLDEHPVTWEALKETSGVLLAQFKAEAINFFDPGPDELLGIPPFWWGFVLSWVGVVLLVYLLTDQNKDYTMEALYGCIAGGLIYITFWFFWANLWWW